MYFLVEPCYSTNLFAVEFVVGVFLVVFFCLFWIVCFVTFFYYYFCICLYLSLVIKGLTGKIKAGQKSMYPSVALVCRQPYPAMSGGPFRALRSPELTLCPFAAAAAGKSILVPSLCPPPLRWGWAGRGKNKSPLCDLGAAALVPSPSQSSSGTLDEDTGG